MSRSAREIRDWMTDRLARLIQMAPEEVDPGQPIRHLGLDSVALVVFATDLEEWLGYRFPSNPLDDHPTIEALATFLAKETAKGGEAGQP